MAISVNDKDLGLVTAYAYAVAGGYAGTEAEFEELLGNIADDLSEIENLSVTIETLPAGASATASYSNGVLHLGIPKGDKGDKGNTGAQGPTGNGIQSITKTGTSGLVDTYTITFTNGNTTTFEVTNGEDGEVTTAQMTAAIAAALADYAKVDGSYSTLTAGNVIDGAISYQKLASDVKEEFERLNAGVDVLFDFHKTSLTWGEIVALIEGGEMSEIFPVASQIKDVWKNTSDSSVEFPWDIVHYSQNGDTWLKLHYAAPDALQFDAPEAIYYFDGTEPAGTYHIPIGFSYGTGWVVGHSIQFTLTAAPDDGDQLFIDCGTNYANDPADGRAWRVYDAGGTTVKQSGTTSEGTGGTSLGTIGNVNANRTNGRLNAISRVVYGYARWSQSAMRQYFNSAEVSWWTMKNPWDRPPAQASTIRGFLCGFSQDFLDHLEETEVVTALNTQEGFAEATETTLDKIFLPSLEQMYINPQLAGVEGESWDYYKALAEEAGLPGKFQQSKTYPILISYNASNTSSAVAVFLRSCSRSSAYSEWYVTDSGYVGNYYAYTATRGCPACKFKKSVQS